MLSGARTQSMKIKPGLEDANRYLKLKRAGLAPKIASIPRAHDGSPGGIGRLCRFLMMKSFVGCDSAI
jgi:hypothetical protein